MIDLFLQGFSILLNWELYLTVLVFFLVYISVQYFSLFKIPINQSITIMLVSLISVTTQSLVEVLLIFYLAPMLLWGNEVNWVTFLHLIGSSSLLILFLLVFITFLTNLFVGVAEKKGIKGLGQVLNILLGIVILSTAGNIQVGSGFNLLSNIPDWIVFISITLGGLVSYFLALLLVSLSSRIFAMSPPEFPPKEYNPKELFITIYPLKILSFVPISIYGYWLASQLTPL